MLDDQDKLFFLNSPAVEFGSNIFINVPIILQYDETPLIEVVQVEYAGFTSQFKVYNRDGIYIAKVKGSQLYLTEEGSKSNLSLRHPANKTVCELDGQTLFEIQRKDAASIRTQAELFTPDGRFMKVNENKFPASLVDVNGSSLQIGGMNMMGCTFSNCRIGVLVRSDGSTAVGAK